MNNYQQRVTTILMILFATMGLLMATVAASSAQPSPEPPGSPVAASAFDAGSDALLAPKAAEEPIPAASEPAASLPDDPAGTASDVVEDIRSGDWRHAVAGILVLLMLGVSKFRGKIKWFSGDRGGATLVLGLAFGGGIATALYGSAPIDLRFALNALSVGMESAGGYTIVKRIIWPSDAS